VTDVVLPPVVCVTVVEQLPLLRVHDVGLALKLPLPSVNETVPVGVPNGLSP